MTYIIRKSSGDKQRFDLEKFRRSLFKAGASPETVETIVQTVLQKQPHSTKKLHHITADFLKEQAPVVANRYNLKHALADLGPEGFVFEKYIAKLLELEGFKTETDVIIPGNCIDHEIDILAIKDNQHTIVECKFHNQPGIKTDVVVTLYMQARFEDLKEGVDHNGDHARAVHTVMVVTNTKFTSEATKYGMCKKIRLLSWDFPTNQDSLAHLIERHKLYPITTLIRLNKFQKQELLRENVVLCKDLAAHRHLLEQMKLQPHEIDAIMQEAHSVCAI